MKKAFTLIELLVVIAIIGILAATILVALSQMRNKAKDSRIKSSIGQIRSIATNYYDEQNPQSYDGFAVDNPAQMATLRDDIDTTNGGELHVTVSSDKTAYKTYSPLVSDNSQFFCADSTGLTGITSTDPGSEADNNGCPAGTQ